MNDDFPMTPLRVDAEYELRPKTPPHAPTLADLLAEGLERFDFVSASDIGVDELADWLAARGVASPAAPPPRTSLLAINPTGLAAAEKAYDERVAQYLDGDTEMGDNAMQLAIRAYVDVVGAGSPQTPEPDA